MVAPGLRKLAHVGGNHAQGSEFLNSPHAEFIGTLTQNNQNSADLSLGSSVYTASNYNSTSFGSATNNSGCTGCHDPHQTTVGSSLGSTAAGLQVAGSNFGALGASGTVTPNNCQSCHAAIANNMLTTIAHPVGAGTPFPNGGTSADIPGSCMICHMQGSTGSAKSHLFRINVSSSYYTYPTEAQYYGLNGTTQTTAMNTYSPSDNDGYSVARPSAT